MKNYLDIPDDAGLPIKPFLGDGWADRDREYDAAWRRGFGAGFIAGAVAIGFVAVLAAVLLSL